MGELKPKRNSHVRKSLDTFENLADQLDSGDDVTLELVALRST